jgi:hypothetical protein
MKCGVRHYLAGMAVLLALAGCGRSFLQYGEERAPWRHEAEIACLKSGAVKIGTGVVQIQPIEGPGMCGADFPLKVSLLGESTPMSYGDDLRPPEGIPDASQPRWPASQPPRYVPPASVQSESIQSGNMRWTPGPQGIEQSQPAPPARYVPPAAQYSPPYEPAELPAPGGRPLSIYAPGVAQPDDIPDDAVLPSGRARPDYPSTQPAYNAPVYQPPQRRAPPALGPMGGSNATTAATPAVLTPPATLACPLVSALDRWITEGVQPAALRWFGSPVAEIKQISAYSCREMVGAGTSHISEHAFGNALDVAAFTLADGRKITVQDGWHGSPEEQGFLHDVQLYACETFTTVLSPGYNVYHYNHIHVDLMRRESGRHPCRPDAIPGEVAAAKARSMYAAKQRGPAYTGSIAAKARDTEPLAVPGQDGYVAGEDDDDTGSIGGSRSLKHGVDHEFDLTDQTPAPPRHSSSAALAGDAATRAQERNSAFH